MNLCHPLKNTSESSTQYIATPNQIDRINELNWWHCLYCFHHLNFKTCFMLFLSLFFFVFFIEETISSICAISNCLLPFVFVAVVVVDDDVVVGVVSSHWILHNTKEVKKMSASTRHTHDDDKYRLFRSIFFASLLFFSCELIISRRVINIGRLLNHMVEGTIRWFAKSNVILGRGSWTVSRKHIDLFQLIYLRVID